MSVDHVDAAPRIVPVEHGDQLAHGAGGRPAAVDDFSARGMDDLRGGQMDFLDIVIHRSDPESAEFLGLVPDLEELDIVWSGVQSGHDLLDVGGPIGNIRRRKLGKIRQRGGREKISGWNVIVIQDHRSARAGSDGPFIVSECPLPRAEIGRPIDTIIEHGKQANARGLKGLDFRFGIRERGEIPRAIRWLERAPRNIVAIVGDGVRIEAVSGPGLVDPAEFAESGSDPGLGGGGLG